MKKLLFSLSLFSLSFLSFSQDNTLPTTGNVGVGTLSPTTRLDVNGNMKIDSSLVIKDSLTVNKTIRVMDKVYIGGKTVMGDNAVAKQNFKVMGNANFDGNATVDGVLRLPNTNTLSNNNLTQGNFNFLLLNENGAARKGSYEDLLKLVTDGVYDTNYPFPNDPLNLCNLVGYNPTWANGPNKIYTGCPEVNVGVRTENPRCALDVHGTTYTNSLAVRIPPNEIEALAHIRYQSSSTTSTAKLLIIENLNRKLLTLDNTGLLRAREIKIDTETWPDYVFEKNYALIPLKEVEKYIDQNGHLPNIPSAETMTEEGINLAEMNRLLLEKIEELTLHIIEQEKRIEALENK